MPSLPELQAGFAQALLGHRGGPPGLVAYRSNVFGNWHNALAGAYPIVRKIVGEEFFRGLAHAYAHTHPSRSGDLHEYGAQLAPFLAAFPSVQDVPYLPDVARMEWLAHRAYYAADPGAFRFEDIGRSETLILKLSPPCSLLESPWPLSRIWTVHQDDYEGAIEVDLAAGPERILVHRPRWRVQVRALAPSDFRFLDSIGNLLPLGEALEAALGEDPEFDAATALARWVDVGVVTL